jgi:hypothetical protein
MVRKAYTKYYIKGIFKGKIKPLKQNQLLEILKQVESEINKNAKVTIKEEKIITDYEQKFHIGQPVFAKNNSKFYEQLRKLKKKSYKNNFHDEPFYVSDVLFWRGIYKYAITSFLIIL